MHALVSMITNSWRLLAYRVIRRKYRKEGDKRKEKNRGRDWALFSCSLYKT